MRVGGAGGGAAFNIEEYERIVGTGLNASPTTEVLIEESVLGWKEYELEVMRDLADNVMIICSIEKFDAMVDGMGHKDVFGKGDSVPEDKQANRDTLFTAYKAVCKVYDVDPQKCNEEWATLALAAKFPKEVAKQSQKQTVDRMRNAEGKFLTSSKPRGAPPAKVATEEEAQNELYSKAAAKFKEWGVSTSGY